MRLSDSLIRKQSCFLPLFPTFPLWALCHCTPFREIPLSDIMPPYLIMDSVFGRAIYGLLRYVVA
jgi:hypothetical protein